jgi:uncharacterized membrane protein YkvA (DUF1232 family)
VTGLWEALLGVAAALLLTWLLLVGALLAARPGGNIVREALRLLPDLLRLVARLGRDDSLPRSVRLRLGLLLLYLAIPIDLVPDFLPVVGYADDLIMIMCVLRSVLRSVGEEPIRRHWPGRPAGCNALLRLSLPTSGKPGHPSRRR